MENRFKFFLLALTPLLSLSALNCFAQEDEPNEPSVLDQIITPDLERRTIEDDILDNEDFEIGLYTGVLSVEDFGSNSVLGIRIAYHVSEDFFLEANVAQSSLQETSFERLSGSTPLFTDDQRDLLYYNMSFGYNILPGEIFIGENWAFNSTFYLVAGWGNTRFGDESHRTVSLGGGLRFYLTDWMAFHLDMRDHILTHDLLGEDLTTNNLEARLGLTIFF